ncbi:MAG: DUF4249 domain-containing protein, partial [Bacteroidota bacterium]
FTGCEEVVDIDLDTAAPRLVVDASINWVKGTTGSVQSIKLTTTAGYYQTEVPTVSNATVFITNSAGTLFTFTEVPNTGTYTCLNFEPQINETYVLTVVNGDQTYTATEKLYAVPEIGNIQQNNEGGFLGDEIEVRFFFQDNGAEDNWYMVRYDTEILPFPEYDIMDDSFTQGNEMFNFFSSEDLASGQLLDMKLYGTSERYYNYMSILLEIAGGGGGPFSTPPSTVRGNLVNQTNEANYALGYFRLSEVDAVQYLVQ